jgi:hypothetical protein
MSGRINNSGSSEQVHTDFVLSDGDLNSSSDEVLNLEHTGAWREYARRNLTGEIPALEAASEGIS